MNKQVTNSELLVVLTAALKDWNKTFNWHSMPYFGRVVAEKRQTNKGIIFYLKSKFPNDRASQYLIDMFEKEAPHILTADPTSFKYIEAVRGVIINMAVTLAAIITDNRTRGYED